MSCHQLWRRDAWMVQWKLHCECPRWRDMERAIKSQVTFIFWLLNFIFTFLLYTHVSVLSCVQLLVMPKTIAHQAPQSMGSSRQEYWLLLLLSHFSRVQLCVTPEMAAYQAPLSLGFSRQEYWSGLPFLSPGDLPDSGTELIVLQAGSLSLSYEGSP